MTVASGAAVANASGVWTTGTVNAATLSTPNFTANSSLVNAYALNVQNQVNTATIYINNSANIASVVQANSSGIYTTANANISGLTTTGTANVTNVLNISNTTGTSVVNGNFTVVGTLSAGTLAYSGVSMGSFIPGTNNTFTIGSSTNVWSAGYFTNVYANAGGLVTTNTFNATTANISGTTTTYNVNPASNTTYSIGNSTNWYTNVFSAGIQANAISANSLSLTNALTVSGLNVSGVSNLAANIAVGGILQLGNTTSQFTHVMSNTYTFSNSNTAANVDLFSPSTYRSAEYLIQVVDSSISSFQITKILVVHDGTNPYMTEYGTIYNSSNMGVFNSGINGNFFLQFTPVSNNCVVRVQRTAMVV